jgi:heat shock protein HslJ
MKNLLLSISFFAMIALVAGCSKNTDNATAWVGTYASTGAQGDSIIQKVTIAEVNSTTLQIQLLGKYNNAFYTLATIQNAKVTSASTITIGETGNIYGYSALYSFSGSGVLSGNNLTISGQAVNTTNNQDVKVYYFSGSK